jgi:tetratricopeptide (TPR) repeat protein
MMRWSMLALWLVFFSAGPVLAGSAAILLDAGRQAYGQGRYAEAAKAFEEAANQGGNSAALSLDTATAHQLAGDPGRAALWLYRAGQAAPGDAAVEKALAAAGLTSQSQGLFLGKRLSPQVVWIVVLWANALFWLALCLARLGRQRRFNAALALAALVVIWLWCEAGWLSLAPVLHPQGVVVKETPALCAPESSAEMLFTLPTGALVRLGPERPGFWRVDAGGDRLGWVPRDAVVPLDP